MMEKLDDIMKESMQVAALARSDHRVSRCRRRRRGPERGWRKLSENSARSSTSWSRCSGVEGVSCSGDGALLEE